MASHTIQLLIQAKRKSIPNNQPISHQHLIVNSTVMGEPPHFVVMKINNSNGESP